MMVADGMRNEVALKQCMEDVLAGTRSKFTSAFPTPCPHWVI